MKTMWRETLCGGGLICVGLLIATILTTGTLALADSGPACTIGQERKIRKGLRIAPVPLDFTHKNPALVGLGSYIVNAQGGCNDCHTNPPYAEGWDPFQGQSPVVNGEGYLAGGMRFGPFVSRNLTPCQDGKPAGLTLEQFMQGMRTGADLKDDVLPPGDTPLLQVMPWPVYGLMTNCDLQAIYEYLRAIPPHEGCIPPGVQASDATP
jgi:hypothetical protein